MVLSCSRTQIVLPPKKEEDTCIKKQHNASLIPIKLNMWQYIINNVIYNWFQWIRFL
jgi:hypothetical protein